MSNKPNRKLPDARFTFSPPPLSHLTDRREKYGARYGSAGDVSTGARQQGFWRYTRIYGNKIDWNMNNPVNPDKQEAMESSSNEDNGTQPAPSDNVEQRDVTRRSEGPENQARQYTDVTDGGGFQTQENRSGPSRNRHQGEDDVPDSFSNTRKFSRIISPTEKNIKKKRKLLKTDRPRANVEQEEDFFEQLFESSCEFISDEAEEHEHGNSERDVYDGDQDDAVFEEMYQKNRQMIQSGKDMRRRKSRDDDNTTTEPHGYRHQGSSTVFDGAGSAAGGSGYGILHRHPSPSKRQLNVHFNNDVSVETLPDADQEDNGTKTLLAHGDGPPNNIPGTSIPLPPPLPHDLVFASRSDNPSEQTLQNMGKSGRDNGKGPLDYKAKVLKNLGKDPKNPSEIRRKDSLPKSVSPTELLRKKQRTVTDKIIKQTLSQKSIPSSGMEIHSSGRRNAQNPVNQNTVKDKINAMEDLVRDLKLPVEAKYYNQLENSSEYTNSVDSSGTNEANFASETYNTNLDTGKKDTDHSFKVDLKKLPTNQRYFQDWNSPFQRKMSTGNNQSVENQEHEDSLREQDEPETRESTDKSPGLGAFEYSTPSKLFQVIKNREEADKNSQGLGAFSYSTPSKLFQKIEDRESAEKNSQELGSFSYTTPSELLVRRENVKESSSKEKPGYWFFKRDSGTKHNVSCSEIEENNETPRRIFSDIGAAENLSDARKDSVEETVHENDDNSQDVDVIKKRRKKFMDRCKRKKRLDHIEHWTEDHHSCAETVETILSNASMPVIRSNVTSESDTRDFETSIRNIRECFDKIATSTSMVEPISMIDDLLSDFLNLMERKLIQGFVITIDILRELEYVYDSLVFIARQLLEQVDETVFQAMTSDPSCSVSNPEVIRKYAVWLSLMLESSDNFLHGIGSKHAAHKTQRECQMRQGKAASQNDPTNLQTVLSDLGVIKDSLTCLRTDDQADFCSITDLRSLGSRDDIRQNSIDTGMYKHSMSDKPPPKQVGEIAQASRQNVKDKPDGSDMTEPIDKRKHSFQERLRRKKSLDQIEHRMLHHSTSADKMASILKNRSPASGDTEAEPKAIIPEPVTKSDDSRKKSFPETNGRFSETMDPFIVTYVYLCDFLKLIERKKALAMDITFDDSRELELIYDTLVMIADQLVSQTEDNEIKAASERLLKQGALERMDSTESISRALQAQRYACWLINKLGNTASLLSSTDMLDYSVQDMAPDNLEHGQPDIGSQVSLNDVIIDLKNIHDSMTSLIYGKESDFSEITNLSLEDMFNGEDSQIEYDPRNSQDSLVSGYLADTNSQESVTGQLYPRDSLLLQSYEKLKTDINGVGETEYCGMGKRQETVRIHDSFVPERQLRHNSSPNSGNMRMPQREWSPRDHRRFSSTDSSSMDDREKFSQYSQVTSRQSSNGEWFYSPTTGKLMFGDINLPSPSISLSKELSLSTFGTLNESDWALIDEQELADIRNGKRKEEADALQNKGWQSMFPTTSPEYYHDSQSNDRRDSVLPQSSDQGQFVDQTTRSGITSQFRPRSQSTAPTATRFIYHDRHDSSKDADFDEFKYRAINETKQSDHQEEAEASYNRRMSLPVNQETLSPSTQRYRKSRAGSLLPQTSKAVQQMSELYPRATIYEEDNIESLPDDSRENILPNRYIPQDMVQVQVRDRLMSTPGRYSTDTFVVHDNASRERILSAVREVLMDAEDSEFTDETPIPREIVVSQVRERLNSIKPRASENVNGTIVESNTPNQTRDRLESMSATPFMDIMTGDQDSIAIEENATRYGERMQSMSVSPGITEYWIEDGKENIPSRGNIDMTSDTHRRMSRQGRGSTDMSPDSDRKMSIPARGSVDLSSDSDKRMSTPARRSIDMGSDSDRRASIPGRGSVYMVSDADSLRDQFRMEGSMTGRPSVDYTPDKFDSARRPSKDRGSAQYKVTRFAAGDITEEETEGKNGFDRAAHGKVRETHGTPGDMALSLDSDRSVNLPTRYAYYDNMRRQKHAFYEMHEKEPALPETLPFEGTTDTDQGGYTRRGSSLTFTGNPVYYETDRYDMEDDGTVDQTEWQAGEDPDSYSLRLSDPTTKSDLSYTQESPKEIHWSARFRFPEDTDSVHVDMGPSQFTVNKIGAQTLQDEQETKISDVVEGDSPERGQRLYGSTQALDRRGDAAVSKRKSGHPTGRSMTPDSRSFLMEKEVSESQNRKLQMEVTTLQTENKLLKEKYNRATAKISELEAQLHDTQDDLNSLQDTLNKEMAELSARTRSELDRDKVQMEKRLQGLNKENERLKAEVSSLEKQLGNSQRETGMARQNSEKNKTIEAHKSEIASLKEELHTVKALLEQSEHHLAQEENRHSEVGQQLLQLTELKNALQQQADSGGSGVATDKQLKSLEKRLKVTEERLHQERADRANNLSAVEEKLLSENARLQASEKEFTRQLHREKDRNKNFEQRLKQVREENEKLRLAMPFDDSVLLSNKETYDIPYSSHSNQRAETLKITDDMNYILSQIERQDGVQSGQEEEMIRVLWNKRELAYKQLRDTELQLKELRLEDNNIVDGLKNLRDTYGQAESKLKQMEDQVEDTRSQMDTLENTYKQQLSQLVQERHDAFARLKTAEDILEAVKTENSLLRQNLSGQQIATGSRSVSDSSSTEALQVEVASLHSKVTQLTRQNKLLDGELSTIRVQLEARTKALEDVQGELEQAQRQLKGGGDEDRRQKIEILTAQLNSLQVDLNNSTEKYNHLLAEKINLDVEVSNMKAASEQQKPRLQPRTETIDSKALHELKDSVAEKDSRLTSLNIQLEETENQLQRTRQDLYIEQEHTAELEAEVDTLQQTVSQRAQMFEALSGTEREQHAQYQLLKETLDSVTQELSHKHAQIISLDVNLSGQKDRVVELERELQDLRQQGTSDGEQERTEVRSGDRLRVQELEMERASLKQELSKAYSAIQAAEEQFRTLQTESKQLEQEVVKEKTVVLQITAEKGEIEQHLEELAEEHDALIQAKSQAEEDLIKLENKLQEILQKYESQARKQHGNFETQYGVLTPESRQMASELDTLRLLLDGKEKEIGMLHDKLSRQLIEIDFLNRKVELVHSDSIANREDVARMISELTLKMKEAVTTREVNQFLAGERTRLQSEKNHVGKELEQERQNSDRRKTEVNEVIRKVEASEVQQMSIKKEGMNKTQQIFSLEAELRSATQNLTTTQTENDQLKSRLDHLQEEVKNLTAINATLEKRLEMEQNSKQVQTRDEEINGLQEELRNLQLELDSSKGQLLLTKDTVQKLSQDKGSIAQDYDGLCHSLTEKERQLNEVRDRTEEKMEFIQREHTAERLRLEQDKTTAERERDSVKQEMDRLNEELKQKEIQLSTFGKTLSDLETATRKKNELEGLLRQLEGAAGDHKLLLEGQRKEVMSLSEALAKQQDENTRLQVTNQTLQMDLKSEQATSSREIHDLKLTLEELKSQLENERTYLNDGLTQTQTQLCTAQESLAAATEARDSLQAQKRLADHTLEELQSQLSDQATGRRLMEQSLGSMRLEVEELRNEKNVSEARLAETKNQLSKNEKQLKSEQEKFSKLSARHQELTAITQSTEASVKAKDEKTDILHKEIQKLRQMLDSQKQSLTAKMKKTQLEFKQQLDLVQEDKNKLTGQAQKLSTDLDLCREQIANKNKENLKLQEHIVTLEDRLREGQVKLKQAEDNLKLETESQSQMSNRYHEQDEELKRLRSFLAKKVEESGEADKSMWHEMNRVIQELSRQMTSHLDAKPSDVKSTDIQTIQRYKKQLAEVQGELSTEKSLHQITKTSLQALDEDCNRLKQQLHKLRRREKSPATDRHRHSQNSQNNPSKKSQDSQKQPNQRKYKNRMEAINAIIARSQTQAQALLASGGYLEDMNYNNPRRAPRSPHRGFTSPTRPDSPDNSYASDLSIASLPPMPFSKYTTSTNAAEAK